jgi:hypothetical protein
VQEQGGFPVTKVDPALIQEKLPLEMQHAARLTSALNDGVSDAAWEQASVEDRRLLAGDAITLRAVGVYSGWSPETATEFFNRLTPEERSLEAWHAAGMASLMQDPQTDPEWIGALPPGPERDAAITALVEFRTSGPLESRDSGSALWWALLLSGEPEREQIHQMALDVWLEDHIPAHFPTGKIDSGEAEK